MGLSRFLIASVMIHVALFLALVVPSTNLKKESTKLVQLELLSSIPKERPIVEKKKVITRLAPEYERVHQSGAEELSSLLPARPDPVGRAGGKERDDNEASQTLVRDEPQFIPNQEMSLSNPPFLAEALPKEPPQVKTPARPPGAGGKELSGEMEAAQEGISKENLPSLKKEPWAGSAMVNDTRAKENLEKNGEKGTGPGLLSFGSGSGNGDMGKGVAVLNKGATSEEFGPSRPGKATAILAPPPDFSPWLKIIRDKIERAKVYPRLARHQGLEGSTTLRFRMTAQGEVERIEIVESSGFPLLDNAAITTVKRAGPFPVVPGWLLLPIMFKLN